MNRAWLRTIQDRHARGELLRRTPPLARRAPPPRRPDEPDPVPAVPDTPKPRPPVPAVVEMEDVG